MFSTSIQDYIISIWINDCSICVQCAIVANLVFWPLGFLGLTADNLAKSATTRTKEATKEDNKRKSLHKKSATKTFHQKLAMAIRIQKVHSGHYLSKQEQIELIGLAAMNMFLVAIFICCPIFEHVWNFMATTFYHQYYCHSHSYRLQVSDPWNWKYELFLKIPIHAIVTEIWFYAFHYFLHWSPFLYQSIHKVHHRFSIPTAMACVYAHPLEFAIGNIFPIFLGPMCTNAHPITSCWIWFPMAMVGTLMGHSGYKLPIINRPDPHDIHHQQFRYNYGGMCLFDYLFGTIVVTPSKYTSTDTTNLIKKA